MSILRVSVLFYYVGMKTVKNLTKYDIVVILVFFSELFDEYPIRGSVRKVFFRFLVGTACMVSTFFIAFFSDFRRNGFVEN